MGSQGGRAASSEPLATIIMSLGCCAQTPEPSAGIVWTLAHHVNKLSGFDKRPTQTHSGRVSLLRDLSYWRQLVRIVVHCMLYK